MPRLILQKLAIAICAGALSGCAGPAGRAQPDSHPGAVAAPGLPRIIAHRGGTGDAPENTLEAIRAAIAHHTDEMWLTVQLSKDGVPVLYRPADLSAQTDASGAVNTRTAAELARINAGWAFKAVDAQGREDHPYRRAPVGIPTLREALHAIAPDMPIILDMKALPAEPQARAVAQVLTEENAWSRVTLYSTEAAYQQAFAAYPRARMFESRDATRTRLLQVLLNEGCIDPPAAHTRSAFELHRTLTVAEQYTLGEGRSEIHATLWTPATVACFRRQPDVRLIAIAVNNAADYRAAACLGMDAVLADSPAQMTAIRAETTPSKVCDASP
ncbi:GP-PDE domain-containing protein [Bordetella sputigena]|uniref:glycerophosphodiester phosphodiesterase family protein n=1 Tax=Bordetella sputigena TaxID=1416810 RepID=UPI0039EF6E09